MKFNYDRVVESLVFDILPCADVTFEIVTEAEAEATFVADKMFAKRAIRRKNTAHKAQQRANRAKNIGFYGWTKECNPSYNKSEAYGMGANGYSSKRWYASRQSELADTKAREMLDDYYAEERIPIKERFHQMVEAYNALVREKSIEELNAEAQADRERNEFIEYIEWLENLEAKNRYEI